MFYSCRFAAIKITDSLFHFRFVLQHGGRVLLADEMGLGKTLQAMDPTYSYAISEIIAHSSFEGTIACVIIPCVSFVETLYPSQKLKH